MIPAQLDTCLTSVTPSNPHLININVIFSLTANIRKNHQVSTMDFLIHTGSAVSVLPLIRTKTDTLFHSTSLQAANGTVIRTADNKTLTFYQTDLDESFTWTFIVAEYK